MLARLVLGVLGLYVSAAQAMEVPVRLLFQNNLNWTDDANHVGALLVESATSLEEAHRACAGLGEALISKLTLAAHSQDFVAQLRYLDYEDAISQTGFWINNTSVAWSKSKQSLQSQTASHQERKFPLCTQSSTAGGQTPLYETSVVSRTNTFIGSRDTKSFRFLGIPYSNPITRFHHSAPSSISHAKVQATSFGLPCVQTGFQNTTEQCLTLNIFTPFLPARNSRPNTLRPVLLWIHGGAFTSGTGSDPTFDGGNLASRSDIVVVTINYRLSTLGFLAIPGTSITGNYGIGDQITALRWVHQNIAAFGGDPTSVTIAGQSAGAASVRALLASPEARGLFAAAIPASNLGGYSYGTTYSSYLTAEQEAAIAGNSTLQATNCTSTIAAEIEECLAAVDPTVLVSVPSVARYVVVDGKIIVSEGLNVTSPRAPGFTAHVPVLWGVMADDGAPFIGFPTQDQTISSAVQAIGLPSEAANSVLQSGTFPIPNTANKTLDLFNVTSRATTDAEFRCVDQATAYSGAKHKVFPATWYYQFDRAYQIPDWNPNAPTCQPPVTVSHSSGDPTLPYFRCHSGDLLFQFGTLGHAGLPFRDEKDLPFMQMIMDYWSSFVRTHNPNPDPAYLLARGYQNTLGAVQKSGTWKAVDAKKPTLRRLDYPPRQDGFVEVDQCATLGLPLNMFEN